MYQTKVLRDINSKVDISFEDIIKGTGMSNPAAYERRIYMIMALVTIITIVIISLPLLSCEYQLKAQGSDDLWE